MVLVRGGSGEDCGMGCGVEGGIWICSTLDMFLPSCCSSLVGRYNQSVWDFEEQVDCISRECVSLSKLFYGDFVLDTLGRLFLNIPVYSGTMKFAK